MLAGLGKDFLVKLGRGLLLRLVAYALFLFGYWLLFQACERSNVLLGVGGGAAVLVAMWAMVGFRRSYTGRQTPTNDSRAADSNEGPQP